MSDVVLSALITVGGMVVVSVVSALVQWRVTRSVIESDHAKIVKQIGSESKVRAEERKRELLHETVAELIAATDPEINRNVAYGDVVKLIHKAQLVLNRDDAVDRELNGELNHLGLSVQQLVATRQAEADDDDVNEAQSRLRVLQHQGRVIDLTQAIIAGYSGRSFFEES